MSLRPEFVRALELLGEMEKPVVVEVGSHQGDGVLYMRAACPSAKIYAIEADPGNYTKLMARTVGKADCRNLVIGSVSGRARINCYRGKNSRRSSVYPEVGKISRARGGVKTVPSMMLDDFCSEPFVYLQPDFIRFDCYGGEYEIFWHGIPEAVKGAKMVLLTMHCKTGLFDNHIYVHLRKRIRKQMKGHGFRVEMQTVKKPHKHQFVLWVKED